MISKIIAATGNRGKLIEIKSILGESVGSVDGINSIISDFAPIEDGNTFAENALIKAKAGVCFVKDCAVLADDSGLVVDALNGEPGIRSARYAGEHATDKQNYLKLLERLERVDNRSAYFVCSIALILPDKSIITAEGRTYGHILHKPQGDNGFGYDPVFFSDELKMSMGEADAEAKNKISHRAKALAKIKVLILEKGL